MPRPLPGPPAAAIQRKNSFYHRRHPRSASSCEGPGQTAESCCVSVLGLFVQPPGSGTFVGALSHSLCEKGGWLLDICSVS